MGVRPRAEIWDRLQEEIASLIEAERGMDPNEQLRIKSIINTLEWLQVDKE